MSSKVPVDQATPQITEPMQTPEETAFTAWVPVVVIG
jgi:hypothetical protein